MTKVRRKAKKKGDVARRMEETAEAVYCCAISPVLW